MAPRERERDDDRDRDRDRDRGRDRDDDRGRDRDDRGSDRDRGREDDRGRDRDRGGDRDRDRGDDRDKDRGGRGGRAKGEARTGGVSIDDEDAIDVGLFSAGRAKIVRSAWDRYDYGGDMRNPPVVWLITFEREGEKHEQPYGIGKGWDLTKKGELVALSGQTGLPKTCNAIAHLVKPLKKALKSADIPPPDGGFGMNPEILEGLEVDLDRVEQEERDFGGRSGGGGRGRDRDRDDDRGRGRDRDDDRGRGRDRGRDNDRGPRTILEIVEVFSAPWDKDGKKTNKSDRAERGGDRDKDRDKPRGREKEKEKEKDRDKDRDDRSSRREDDRDGRSKGDDAETNDKAIEALIAVVEKGEVKIDDLEDELAKVLKGEKGIDDVIDLATSPKFLKQEKGWKFDGDVVDAAKSRSRR